MLRRVFFLTLLIFSGFWGVSWADDCGLRANDGSGAIIKLDCEDAAATTSQLRVTLQDGSIRGLKLVDPTDASASKFRVRYTDRSSGTAVEVIKAVGKILPGITSCEELQMIGFHPKYPLNGNYVLGTDIDCSATNPSSPAYATSLWGMGYAARFPNGFDGIPESGDEPSKVTGLTFSDLGTKGWKPIMNFAGKLEGQGGVKMIRGLYVNRTSNGDGFGALVGRSLRAQFRNLDLTDVNIKGISNVGALVGESNADTITHCYSSGTVAGKMFFIGGLVGSARSRCEITSSHSSAVVIADGVNVDHVNYIGGLVGQLLNGSIISLSYFSGNVTGKYCDVGGLVGYMKNSTIANCYSSGSVSGEANVGGLVGVAEVVSEGGIITNSYSSGPVTGSAGVGGFIGSATCSAPPAPSSAISRNSFSAGDVVASPGSDLFAGTGGWIAYFSYYSYYGAFPDGLNNWWYNTTSGTTGIRILSSHTDDMATLVTKKFITKAAASNDFYGRGSGTGGAVYTGTSPWDFDTVWQANASSYPTLRE